MISRAGLRGGFRRVDECGAHCVPVRRGARHYSVTPIVSIRSAAEAAAALLKGADGPKEIDLAKGRPRDIGEIKFAVGALPQQKAGKANLAAGADDQVRVGQPGRVEMAGDGF